MWLAPRSKSVLIRWGWIVLNASEKSINTTCMYDPDLSRWHPVRFTRTRLQHPFWHCRQTVKGPCDQPHRQPTGYTLSSPYNLPEQMSKPQAWNFSSVHWNWYYDWSLPHMWNSHAIQEQLKQMGKHWSQLWWTYLKYSTLKATWNWSLRGVKSRKTWNYIFLFHALGTSNW